MRKSWVAEIGDYAGLFKFLRQDNADIDSPQPVIEQLGKWSILNDVPFQYYVPREDMLPQETARFFHVDHNWLLSLLDGACSIGRTTNIDYTHDMEIIERVYLEALARNVNVRRRLQRKPELVSSAGDTFPVCTGFLLRSELVRGWRGLEFKAYDHCTDTTPAHELRAIRIETLSENVLLGIYRGLIKRVEIAQPPEGLHYGFAAGYKKSLRYLTSGKIIYKETQGVMEAVTASITVKSRRVIDWRQSAHSIARALSRAAVPAVCPEGAVCPPVREPAPKEDAALIALQMIQNAYTGVIKHSQPDNP